jgi:FKBP-type peptidyl-prolyl cis-trans isomerase 2
MLIFLGDDLVEGTLELLTAIDMEAYSKKESVLRLSEALLRSETDIKHGRLYSVEETADAMKRVITEVADTRQRINFNIMD